MPGILLGTIQFQNREIPDIVKFGDKQVIAVHRLMGGTRVLDTLGPDPHKISWDGLFLGANAAARARAVDAMAQSGAEVNLNWGTFSYLVVVADFRASYKHEWEIRYSITCEVVSSSGASAGTPVSLTTVFASDFAQLLALINANPAIPAIIGTTSIPASVAADITAAQTAFNDAAAATTGGSILDVTLPNLQPVINSSRDALTSLESNIGTPSNGLNLETSTTQTSVLDGINAFANEVNNRSIESDQITTHAYLGRITSNLEMLGG